MRILPYRRSVMILPNPPMTDLQEYINDGTMCLDISNNLSQETNRSDNSTVDYDNMCVICLESVENKKTICLQCTHKYHPYCIIKWLSLQQRNKSETSCPVCKQECDCKKIVSDLITIDLINIENIIKNLNCITKYCDRILVQQYNIITLKRNYSKIKFILAELYHKEIKDPLNCQYIYIKIIPLTENVLKLLSEAESKEIERKAETPVNCSILTILYKIATIQKKRAFACLKNK